MSMRLTISVDANGGVKFEGPLHDKVLCYGLLEIAKDIVRTAKPPVIQPVGVLPHLPPPSNGKAG